MWGGDYADCGIQIDGCLFKSNSVDDDCGCKIYGLRELNVG